MKEISIIELFETSQNLKEGEKIIDVRTEDEFRAGHVPGALNFSHDAIEDHIEELKAYSALYLYCRSGRRVSVAGEILEECGFKEISGVTDGGMPDWEGNGYPVKTGLL